MQSCQATQCWALILMNQACYWSCGGDEGAAEGWLEHELCLTAAGIGATGNARAAWRLTKGGSSSSHDSLFADGWQKHGGGKRAPISFRKHGEIYGGKLKPREGIQPELASVGQTWWEAHVQRRKTFQTNRRGPVELITVCQVVHIIHTST